MELWQIDVMGGVMLEGGTELKAITGIDDHSRYCVMATLVHRATARPVCEALMDALSRYGVPEQILTDNGKVFTGRLAPKPSTVAFDRICLNNGIRHLLTAPYSPTTTGKIERLHKTIRKELVSGRTFTTIEQAQASSMPGSPTTTVSANIRRSATCLPSGASSWCSGCRSRSSIRERPPKPSHDRTATRSRAVLTERGGSASSSTATTSAATWPASALPWSPSTACSRSATTAS